MISYGGIEFRFFVVVLFSINQSILYQDVRVLLEHSNLLDFYSGNFKSLSIVLWELLLFWALLNHAVKFKQSYGVVRRLLIVSFTQNF